MGFKLVGEALHNFSGHLVVPRIFCTLKQDFFGPPQPFQTAHGGEIKEKFELNFNDAEMAQF